MNKQTYMEELIIKLKDFPQDLIDEIVSDYEGHFEFGLKTGKSENDVIESLGDIDSLVDEIRLNFKQSENEKDHVFNYPQCKSVYINNKEDNENENIEYNYTDKNLYSGSFSSENFPNINTLDINIVNSEIQMNDSSKFLTIEWNSDQPISPNSSYYPRIECINNVIYCTMEKNADVSNFFRRNESPNIEFEIGIPARFENILVNSRSGSLIADDLKVTNFTSTTSSGDLNITDSKIENIQLSSLSGDTCLSSCKIKNTDIQSKSGDISLDDFTSDYIKLENASGDCDVDGLTNTSLRINTASGDISISDIVSENLTINSASGDIDGSDIKCPELTLVTASGDISIETTSKNIKCIAASGDISIEVYGDSVISSSTTSGCSTFILNNDNNGFKASVKSVSGETEINYDDIDAHSSRNGTHVYGNQGTILNIQSISGDIEIN